MTTVFTFYAGIASFAYLHRALLESAAALCLTAPVLVIAIWRTRTRQWRPILIFCGLLLFDEFVLLLPRAQALANLHWNWQGKTLEILWPLLLAAAGAFTLREIGITSRIVHGWARPTFSAVACTVALPLAFFVALHAREQLTAEGWLFQLTMPGLAEEIVYRGVFLMLLDRAFSRPWRVLGANVGWGLVVSSVLFAAVHVVYVRSGHLQYDWTNGIGPLIGSFITAWLRQRVDSIWPAVLLHNVSNLVIPALSLL